MKGMRGICYQCKDRTIEPNCHTTCKKYLEAVEEFKNYKATVKKNRKEDDNYNAFKRINVRATINEMHSRRKSY